MKVAIIHYWFVGMRGGENVIEALCEMYPQADIFTHVYVPERFPTGFVGIGSSRPTSMRCRALRKCTRATFP
jgi:hypothetical protein